MLDSMSDDVYKAFEEAEWAEPRSRKVDHTYMTRQGGVPDDISHPLLCELGDTQFGGGGYVGDVMLDLY